MEDYYELLGINKNTSTQEVKKAYRRLAHKYHPDRNSEPNAEQKFKQITEAYETLSNPQKKEKYDNPQSGFSNNFGGFGGFGDLFDFFGGGRQQYKGRDLKIRINIELIEAFKGTTKNLSFNRNVQCYGCKGMGGKGTTCGQCSGYGHLEQKSSFVRMTKTCDACRGSGVKISSVCSICHGKGQTPQKREILVKIPPGIKSGNQIKVAGEGEITDPKHQPGDLFCIINVSEHKKFKINSNNLYSEEHISFAQACLGDNIKVSCLDDSNVSLKIPPGTTHGTEFEIKNKGMPDIRNPSRYGSQHVRVAIKVPTEISKNAKSLIKELDKKLNEQD